jgi:hypothetical protein
MAQKSLLNRQCSVLTRTENRRNKPTKKLPHSFHFFSFFPAFTEIDTATTSQNFQIQLLQLSQTRKQARHQKTPPKIPPNRELKTERWIAPKKKTLQIHGGGRKEEEVQSLSVPDSKRSEVAEAPVLPPLALTTKSTSLHRRKVDAKKIFYQNPACSLFMWW